MICPKCQTNLPDGAKFCKECGQKIEMVCPECGKSLPPDSKFCLECGNDLSKPFVTNDIIRIFTTTLFAA